MGRTRAVLLATTVAAASAVASATSTAQAATATFANNAGMALVDAAVAAPYPSTINVSGVTGTVTDVRVRLENVSHGFPGDIDLLLVGPTGQSVVLLSDQGGTTDLVDVDLAFADGGAAVPAAVVSGTYVPTNSGAGDPFPAPAPAGPHGTTLDGFDGLNPNGTWSLYAVDDAGADVGDIEGWSLRITTGTENETPISAGPGAGVGSPYPSAINVAGATGLITSVSVTLTSVTSSFPDDLDVLLVGPGGQRVLLVSDAGGTADVTATSLTFESTGAALPDDTALNPGVYRPTDFDGNDGALESLPAPAPARPYGLDLEVFDGTSPNGTWQLFVADDQVGDAQTLARGWSIDFQTAAAPPPAADPCAQPPVVEDGFGDVAPANVHESNIDCIAHYGIAQGIGGGLYSPTTNVSRAQIASFVARLLRVAGVALPANPPDAFPGDNAGPPHELSINQLAAVGVIGGNGETGASYNPTVDMRRDHMASFLANAYEVIIGAPLAGGPNAFTDDEGNPHEPEINALAAAGVVQGTGGGLYNPSGSVTRGSMGSFLARTLQLVVDDGATATPI